MWKQWDDLIASKRIFIMCNFISSSGRFVGFSAAITALMLGSSGCVESLEEKAAQGDSAAQLELAEYHRDGKNSAEELRYLQMAAQGKEPRALKMMAEYYNKRKDFRQAAYFHVIRLNTTGERGVAEKYANFLSIPTIAQWWGLCYHVCIQVDYAYSTK